MAKKQLTIEEKIQAALVPAEEQPYKVPENWCWTRLGNVAQWGSGGTPSRKNHSFYEGDIPWIKTGELNEEYIYDTEEHISKEALEKSSAKIFPVNTVVLAMYGATIGKVGILGVPATTNQACACGVCSKGIKFAFLAKFLQSQKQSFIMKGKGGAQPNISQQIIKNHPIALPPLAEQSRIVARIESLFAKLDEAKAKIQEVLDGADLRRAAILHQAFTGKLTEKWRKENSVDDKSWEFTSLGNICYINPKKIDTTNFDDDMEVSFIPMADVSDISGEVIGNQTRPLGEVKKGFTNFNEGDVVFAKITPCMENGKSAIIGKLKNNVGYGTTEFYVLRPKETLYNRYVYHLVRSKFFRDKAKSNMTGAVGQQRVPKKFMQEYEINLPSMQEQKEIVQLLDNLLSREQSTVTACEEALTTIDTLKKSILARAFRGELGTNDPSEAGAQELLQEILAS